MRRRINSNQAAVVSVVACHGAPRRAAAHGGRSLRAGAAYALITAFDSQLPSIYRKKCPFRNFNGPSFFSFFCCSSVAPMNEIYRRSCCNDVCENALDDGATAAAEAKNIGARGILVSHLTVLTI